MNLSTHLNAILTPLLAKSGEIITNESLIHCIDLTLLTAHSSSESLTHLNKLANQHTVAAVCVFPEDLSHFKLNEEIRLATVVNFPHGNEAIQASLNTINQAIQQGAQEIDYVVPYSAYLQGNKKQTLDHATQIARCCEEHNVILKIILETGAFSDLRVLYELCRELLELKVDFLKTSTGKISQGATFDAVFTVLSAIKDSKVNCGIKISGGLKSTEQAKSYAALAQLMLNQNINKKWFRIGASSLLDDLVNATGN